MKRKKIIIIVGIVIGLLFLSIVNVDAWDVNIIEFYPDTGIVKLNGEEVPTASKPLIVNDRLYVPIRTVSELIGATITWNSIDRYATMYVPDFISMLTELDEKDKLIEELSRQMSSVGVYADVLDLLRGSYLYKDRISIQNFTYNAIKGAIQSLGDPYVRFFSPEEVARREALLGNDAERVGIELTRFSSKYIILNVIENTPAYYSGLQSGDVIRSIDGVYVSGLPFDDVKMLLSSTTTKNVVIDVIRAGELKTFTVKTSIIPSDIITYELIDVNGSTVAYIRVREIKEEAAFDMDNVLKTIFFKSHGEADAYIIDLRGNFGGDVGATKDLLSFFLGGKPVYKLTDSGGNETVVRAPVTQWMISDTRPIYVLVDEGTTSAAEVFAIAMKSYSRAILVGQTTYGKGVATSIYRLRDGSVITFPTYKILGPKDEIWDGAGILPHVWTMTLYAKQQAISLFEKGIFYPTELGD